MTYHKPSLRIKDRVELTDLSTVFIDIDYQLVNSLSQ